MIDAIITYSIRHRGVVIAAGVVLGILGAWAAWTTPVDAIPDLSDNQVIVFVEWKGHGPREIEEQATYPLALGLQGLRGVRVVRSSSEVGFAMISVILEDRVAMAEGRRRVDERVARLRDRLPEGATAVLGPDSPATGQIYWYNLEGGGLDLGQLRDLQDWYVGPQLSSVPGVAEVASVGGFPTEYEVAVDPLRLAAEGVTLRDVMDAVAESNAGAGGHVIHKGNAEYVVRGVGWLGASPEPGDSSFDRTRAIRDLEDVVVPRSDPAGPVRLGEVARMSIAPGYRRGALEKDGNEVAGGVVLIASGENPLEVTRRIKAKVREIEPGLPDGVRIVPFYDRTPLIEGAIRTVTGTVVEAIATASLCVLLILLHVRTSFVIALTLPLAALSSFLIMAALRHLGILDLQANAMSLAGIAISVGVLVDSSIVMAENVMHRLHGHSGGRPVRGDTRDVVLPACLAVGRPIVFSVAIMLLSFLPVFALGGIEGKMFRPLAYTKSFALLSVAVLAITLVPALCTVFIRGRIRSDRENPLVRGVIEVYRPVLSYMLDHPVVLAWIIGATFLLGFAPLGSRPLFLATLAAAFTATAALAKRRRTMILAPASLLVLALWADQVITPLEREFMVPLDEGMVMDMPITVPRASVTQAVDDLKARDMALCRFPEVEMVVGKAGRAETPTDPAPIDMIESMVSFRPRAFWPRRSLRRPDARRQAVEVLDALVEGGMVRPPADRAARDRLLDEAVDAALPTFDVVLREFASQRNLDLVRRSGGRSPLSLHPSDPEDARLVPIWYEHVKQLNSDLIDRGAAVFTRLILVELLARAEISSPETVAMLAERQRIRAAGIASLAAAAERGPISGSAAGEHHHHHATVDPLLLPPQPPLDRLEAYLAARLARRLLLWKVDRDQLVGFGGELDRVVSMPGWTNVWTMPIQNRVDMLATGVNTMVGVRVMGRDLDDVVLASERIAAAVGAVAGAADVIADPVRGKPYLEIRFDRARAARLGVSIGEANEVIEAALAGKAVTTTAEGRVRHPVVVRYRRDRRQDEDAVRDLLVPARGGSAASPRLVPLDEVADVLVVEGPATIKGENGFLRNYVRMNVRGRDAAAFVAEARRVVAGSVELPPGVFVEWTGQFEHEVRSRRTLAVVVPLVVALIFLLLYWTYHDLADAALMMLAVPGAVAGGLFFQWCLGFKLSVTVWVGYIACFGMATSTGIIMLVYLREAVERAGGLGSMGLDELRRAVLDGAAHRLRPKLLTEGTVVIGLAPMLWSSGVASEVIRPMVAPVMGGILVADEVIDLLLPVLFYWVRRSRWHRLHAGRGQVPQDVDPAATPVPVGGAAPIARDNSEPTGDLRSPMTSPEPDVCRH
ncbi:efflux RND transporter permease subunit [Tautonia plasticadhaerens]|uniref:Cation efflux system protein CusA n=1 Tax=Tautonia plasticadhaerens TaxID=2527974 RepID=A0A518H5V5_9BACT|nr:efflux RND transporter permease subunit [Tautonia plasticadhaerens]QDV36222.1 Cation efflux system protein CusA [Tautonia plasticadhaerens]